MYGGRGWGEGNHSPCDQCCFTDEMEDAYADIFFSKNFIFYCEIVYGVLIRFCLQNPTLALRYNDIDIKMTTCDKILGIQVDENLIWNSQCQQSILIFIAVEQNKIIFIH